MVNQEAGVGQGGAVDKVCKYNIFTLGLGSSGYPDDCQFRTVKLYVIEECRLLQIWGGVELLSLCLQETGT